MVGPFISDAITNHLPNGASHLVTSRDDRPLVFLIQLQPPSFISHLKMSTTAEMLSRTVTLPNGLTTPQIHLGLYMLSPSATYSTVYSALKLGYRGFDSAQWYSNEKETGQAILDFLASGPSSDDNASGIKREDIFYTTKLKDNSQNYDAVKSQIDKSVKRCGLGYVDLFLLHSPLGGEKARKVSWKALVDAQREGKIKNVGVSNYGVKHLQEFEKRQEKVVPAVNQIEVHPFNTQVQIREKCREMGIQVQAYAPLARGMRFGRGESKKLAEVAKKYGCTEAQVMVRWSLQKGFVTLPKSSQEKRMKENADVGWFELEEGDLEVLDGLDEGLVTDWDPTDAP
ncbi:NADP-dependent oxidoreductase domain-containing protein [Cladorrhinum sp. PSN259]|nr:NADP-dependent oxidoreductase domain-containing protein [Cladorrhinum sp. PSN259]